MIINLFSSFDPSSLFRLSLNWLSSLIGLILIPLRYWLIPSRKEIFLHLIFNSLIKEFSVLVKNYDYKNILLFLSLFLLILINNFLGLFPYIFTNTRHISITLSLALPIWLRFMIFGWINNCTHILSHLVPQGTPRILIPFIVCIETIRNIIRPGTLAIRLSANIIAGHLLITLLGNTGSFLMTRILRILIFIQLLLLVLETAVSIIQAYVFAILRTLYSREVN